MQKLPAVHGLVGNLGKLAHEKGAEMLSFPEF